MAARKCATKGKSRVQSLIFPKRKRWTAKKARAWAKDHGYKATKVHETDKTFRLRQFDPKACAYRTIPFGPKIQAVIEVPTRSRRQVSDALDDLMVSRAVRERRRS